jgi:hypothetical protein
MIVEMMKGMNWGPQKGTLGFGVGGRARSGSEVFSLGDWGTILPLYEKVIDSSSSFPLNGLPTMSHLCLQAFSPFV